MKNNNLSEEEELLEILNQSDNYSPEPNNKGTNDVLDQEVLEILAQADENPAELLLVDEFGELQSVDEIKQLILSDTDDPDKKYELYYSGIQMLLKRDLPKGKHNKQIRDITREEINTFLSRGKRKVNGKRGKDSRMGYVSDMEIALDKIIEWSRNKGTVTDLYNQFLALNNVLNQK